MTDSEWKRRKTANLVNSLKLMLDHGEAEAIALAVEKRARIVLDDRQARTWLPVLASASLEQSDVSSRQKNKGYLPK